MALKRDPKIREELKSDMGSTIKHFFDLHSFEPATGFFPNELAEHILTSLEAKGWHGTKKEYMVFIRGRIFSRVRRSSGR